ncbi:immunoglobulin lambda-1 light chain-like [Rhinophrynus dorsalis]
MDFTLVTLLLASLSFCCSSRFQIHQPQRVSASEGSTVALSCMVEGKKIEGLSVQWFQQVPGSPPTFILSHGNDSSVQQMENFASRFQPIRNSSSNTHILKITQITTSDSALYWCMLVMDPFFPVWGNGTYLSVFGGDRVLMPTVILLRTGNSLTRSSTIHIICLVSNFYPAVIEVIWKLDGQTAAGGITGEPWFSEESRSYSLTSMLELRSHPRKDFSSVSCEVRHESSRTLISKDLFECY